MDDKNKEELKRREISASEQRIELEKDAGTVPEKREILEEEKLISEELKREIELMEMNEELKDEAKNKAKKIGFLGEKEKIERLLQIAREKGVVFAIQTAKAMNDPYLLDIFHDMLAREGYYKQFMK
ncbi:MAG: hypothetical protein ABIJ84_02220 [bacterium]